MHCRFLNLKLDDITLKQPERYPHLVRAALRSLFHASPKLTTDDCQLAVKNMFIRGSVVRYVQLPKAAVDTQLLEDATRRGRPQLRMRLALPGTLTEWPQSPQRQQIRAKGDYAIALCWRQCSASQYNSVECHIRSKTAAYWP